MAEPTPDDFVPFMTEVTGHPPFPWQRRLLDVVLESGWPSLLDLPTGTGKTSTILVALFALALDPSRHHRRIVLVVDRRIIVDQVDGFARRLQTALLDPSRPVCTAIAARLRALAITAPGEESEPVRTVHLRGGIPRDDTWLGTPDRPAIIASTVDQVGSRLLFRGYGVSEGMRPVHAGVLARDTLLLLDEVHLATAFEETLDRLERTYDSERWAEQPTGRRLSVVRMSATPRPTSVEPRRAFGLDAADRAHPELAKRLGASRMATLELVKTKKADSEDERATNRARVAEAACARAQQAMRAGATAVGIVVNRVDTARRTAALLRTHDDLEVLLLTGRMRPFDKAAAQTVLDRIAAAGRTRDPNARPAVVVATSCIEAGADLDFDALVTEAASLDALRQRFGRLDRLGTHGNVGAWILGCTDQLSANAKADPIYGDALRHTWEYLQEVATEGRVDFGLETFPAPTPERLRDLLPPIKEAPVLFPAYLDLWSETRPAPHPDPDPSLWLHGKDTRPKRDVSVVFRGDVEDGDDPRNVSEALEFLPPVADEAVSVPLEELRRWLASRSADSSNPTAWRWTADGLELTPANRLRPNDTIIVPAILGGLGLGTWDPASTERVPDVAELATWQTHDVAKLRLDRRTLPEHLRDGCPTPPAKDDDADALDDAQQACLDWLDALSQHARELDDGDPWQPLLRALADPNRRRAPDPAPSPTGRVWRVTALLRGRAVAPTTEDAVSVFSGAEVTLDQHLRDVEAWAGAFGRTAGLATPLASDLALAALLHDLGKADLRFQAMLRGGDPIAAAGSDPLAKSRRFGSAASRQRAQQRSGWPTGLRHELLSLALLDASPRLQARAHDLELVRHLVASHHGWCRPWAPSVIDPSPQRVRAQVAGIQVDVSTDAIDDAFLIECASRFRRLCHRYGWHGLAYLEALLRLGDHRASATPGVQPGDRA
ncbi:type I-G CRISPR-associated helicase/endonuclease Cas3g [Paraliomyxa miuraensis]|uniref:type I-G CRISPR-associated helicase/endonuclease Cas3g n=1 Tax=Paraliomyxa miuraensis TaxID=376150 RepID=UPI0022595ED7|nr:type I-U CRISPR-associated helicase/endonuclease Cas3 [Paraliomyxa miuraensis]MCX4242534.1 type I-U CRISPR-associated helicase/endonuclease Cas3 [Paraliomyxa miuraensis]